MTKALAINQRQIKVLCEGARKAGYAPIVQIGNVTVRFVPEEHAIPKGNDNEIDDDMEIRF